MKKNIFGAVATIAAIVVVLLAGSASRAAAQRLPKNPIPVGGYTLTLPSPTDLVEITAGAFHTCVRQYGGAVYCWGLNGWYTGTGGQIGVPSMTANCADSVVQDPSHISIAPTTKRPCVDRPTYVTQSSQIVAGYYHTCSLNLGVASCWGSNSFGAVGDSTLTDRSTPQNVMTSVLFTRLAGGDSATCGLSQSGVYCWGYLPYDPTVSAYSSTTPKQLHPWTGFSGLTVGSRFLCVVYTVGTWGENDCQGIDNVGQLGITDTSWMPKDSNNIPYINTTVLNSTGVGADGWDRVARSSAGADYVCADVTDGTVQCVGSNAAGQLGTSGANRANAMAVANSSGSPLQLHGVTTGASHACALDASGSAWCWGLGRYGEIGNATTGWYNQASYAQSVAGGITFRSLAAGAQHTCGIGTDNNVYCWGDNEYGQLGVGYHNLGFSGFNYVDRIGTPQRVPAF